MRCAKQEVGHSVSLFLHFINKRRLPEYKKKKKTHTHTQKHKNKKKEKRKRKKRRRKKERKENKRKEKKKREEACQQTEQTKTKKKKKRGRERERERRVTLVVVLERFGCHRLAVCGHHNDTTCCVPLGVDKELTDGPVCLGRERPQQDRPFIGDQRLIELPRRKPTNLSRTHHECVCQVLACACACMRCGC